ncbi:MAG: flippase-like domain-containing protein [Candidatus Tectomicrobia bacterium]|nr:flippase-like domain-containing protein [Candidatus Tectomicrobia bacterium]
MTSSKLKSTKPLWRRYLTGILFVAAMIFVLSVAWTYRYALIELLAKSNLYWVAIALLLLVIANSGIAALFALLVQRDTGDKHLRLVAAIFLLSQLAKYVPGRVWTVLLQATLVGGRARPGRLVTANLEIALFTMTASLSVGIAALAFVVAGAWASWVVFILLSLGSVLLLRLDFTVRVVVTVLRIWRKWRGLPDPISEPISRPSCKTMFIWSGLFIASYTSGWLLLLTLGLGHDFPTGILMLGAIAAAWALGTLSMLPGGIGVREAVFVALGVLTGVNATDYVAVAVATRIVLIILDALSTILGWLLMPSRTTESPAKD